MEKGPERLPDTLGREAGVAGGGESGLPGEQGGGRLRRPPLYARLWAEGMREAEVQSWEIHIFPPRV